MQTIGDKVHTIGEISKMLRISRPTTLALLRDGKLHGVAVGSRGQWRVTDSALSAFLWRGTGSEEKETTAS
jgi:excisionase family DNA binding protein